MLNGIYDPDQRATGTHMLSFGLAGLEIILWYMTFALARPFLTDWLESFGRVLNFLLTTRAQLSEASFK